jgi:hypothetical protein
MRAEDFSNIWENDEDTLNTFTEKRLRGLSLKDETIDYLVKSGLPKEAAPFLTFANATFEEFCCIDTLTNQFDFLEPEFEKYVVIGSDGGGNPIVINKEINDRIEWLDHEDCFSSMYMNESLNSLLEFLILYRQFVSTTRRIEGEEAYINGKFRDIDYEELKHKMGRIDSNALLKGFWQEELEMLIANRTKES